MTDLPHRRMGYVTEALETDPEYLWLRSCRDRIEEQVAGICAGFSLEEREVFMEYWRISQEMMMRIVEIACFAEDRGSKGDGR